MALQKDIKQPDGVTTSYHRVSFVQIATNQYNAIAVISYVDAECREAETAESPTYQKAVTYMTEYSPSMSIELAYEYLKTLPQFEGAIDT